MSRFLDSLEGKEEDRKSEGRTESYSSLRSGFVDLVESGLGVGDELDGMIRRLSGDAATIDEGIDQSRRDLDYFERKNPVASKLLTGAGVGASLFIPALRRRRLHTGWYANSKVYQDGRCYSGRGRCVWRVAGRDEERLDSALLGAGIGGALGAGVGRFLTKGADEYAAVKKADAENIGVGGAIGGDEDTSVLALLLKGEARSLLTPAQRIERSEPMLTFSRNVPNDLKRNSYYDTGESIVLTARNWGINNVGVRPTALVQRAELGMRKARNENDFHFADSEEKFKLLGKTERFIWP